MVKQKIRRKKKGLSRKLEGVYLRNFIFGVDDSLVSTVGLLSGIAIANVPRSVIFVTGLVYLFVEAFSMAMGSILSEHSVEEYERRKETPLGKPLAAGSVMFFSYFISGFIPLLPYLMIPGHTAFWVSISASTVALFGLGMINAKMFGTNMIRKGTEMLVIGGSAIVIGILVGRFFILPVA